MSRSAPGFLTRAPGPPPPARAPRPLPTPTGAPHPDAIRSALSLLAPLPVHAGVSALPPFHFHVRGRADGPARRLDVSVPDLDAVRVLALELPGHLAAPAPWRLTLPDAHPIEFVCGYQRARRACLPGGGTFTAASVLGAASLPCPYPAGTPQAAAFRAGARRYLECVLHFTPPGLRGAEAGKEHAHD